MNTLQEANSLINGDRKDSYGDIYDNSRRIIDMFNNIAGTNLKPEHYPLFMVCVKLVREGHSHKRDNIVDLEGYMELYNQIVEF